MEHQRNRYTQSYRKNILCTLKLLMAGVVTSCTSNMAPQSNGTLPTPTSMPSIPIIKITATEYGYIMPDKLDIQSGFVDFAVVNNGSESHQAQVARLNPGVTNAQVFNELVTKKDEAAAYSLLTFVGGPDTMAPGYGQETILNMTPGQYVLLCFVVGADGIPHTSKGMVHFFAVSADHSAASIPAVDGQIVMNTMSYTLPEVMNHSQPLLLQVTNQGTEAHELNIVKIAAGKGTQDIASFFQSPSGQPPFEELGGMAALMAGSTAWIKIHLEPGHYAVFSFIPDIKTGQSQLSLGMITTLTVH